MYRVCIVLHLLAAFLWLGHMFIWSLFAMPALKRVEPAATADLLRERSLYLGGLGWPALIVLIPTGMYMLAARGIRLGTFSRERLSPRLAVARSHSSCVLVGCMVLYQALFGHGRARVAIHVNILIALVLLAASVVIARGGA